MGMDKASVKAAAMNLDWSKFPGAVPTEGAVYPKVDEKSELMAQTREAFRGAGMRQIA